MCVCVRAHVCVRVCVCACVMNLSLVSDLFWEQHYTLIDWVCGEETDRSLVDYPLPEQVETLIDRGKYQNVETKITKVCS